MREEEEDSMMREWRIGWLNCAIHDVIVSSFHIPQKRDILLHPFCNNYNRICGTIHISSPHAEFGAAVLRSEKRIQSQKKWFNSKLWASWTSFSD